MNTNTFNLDLKSFSKFNLIRARCPYWFMISWFYLQNTEKLLEFLNEIEFERICDALSTIAASLSRQMMNECTGLTCTGAWMQNQWQKISWKQTPHCESPVTPAMRLDQMLPFESVIVSYIVIYLSMERMESAGPSHHIPLMSRASQHPCFITLCIK